MAKIVSTLGDAIGYLNTLYNGSTDVPVQGDEDYTVWASLMCIAISLWENEEGMLWKELFVKLADASDGTKTITAGTYTYTVPTNFKFPSSGYVWLGSGSNKTAMKVLRQEDLQLYENDTGNWCYFLLDTTPTLEFNPNCTLRTGDTISYTYYKTASQVATATDTFDMADPMFCVYYALSELKKEEGDTSSLTIATQKLEAMRTRNVMPAYWQEQTMTVKTKGGFGV